MSQFKTNKLTSRFLSHWEDEEMSQDGMGRKTEIHPALLKGTIKMLWYLYLNLCVVYIHLLKQQVQRRPILYPSAILPDFKKYFCTNNYIWKLKKTLPC